MDDPFDQENYSQVFPNSQKGLPFRPSQESSQSRYFSESEALMHATHVEFSASLDTPAYSNGGLIGDTDPTLLLVSQNSCNLSQQKPEDLLNYEGNSSFSEFLNAANLSQSFNFEILSEEMSLLSQGIPAGADTPPQSAEPHIFEEEQNGFNTMNTIIKTENIQANDVLEGGRQQVDDADVEGNGEADSSQDELSQGKRFPELTRFPGEFNFSTTPLQMSSLKCVYTPETNKIFCVDNYPIMFKIKLDFNKVSYRKLKVEALLYYNCNSSIQKPVKQCASCYEAEAGKSPNRNVPLAQYDHVVRCCDNDKAQYFKRKGVHNCVSVPLEKLQGGADGIKRNYTFMCRSSCHVKAGSKSWTLVFYLMDGRHELGRDVYNIKVCKCPRRDSNHLRNKNVPSTANGQFGTGVTKVNDNAAGKEDDQQCPETPPKRARISREIELGKCVDESTVAGNLEPRPGPSRLCGRGTSSNGNIRPGKGAAVLPEIDSEPFSQDSSQRSGVGNDERFVAKFNRSLKSAMAFRQHPNMEINQFSRFWMKQLYYMDKQMSLFEERVVGKKNGKGRCDPLNEGEGDGNEGDPRLQ